MAQADKTTLVLADSDHFIHDTSSSTPTAVYSLSTSIDSLTYKDSSVNFSRALHQKVTSSSSSSTLESDTPATTQKEEDRLYNLVHPANADYRTDIPARFFLTCHSPSLSPIGNIKLVTSKSLLSSKPDKIKAIHYPNRTATTSPLFPEEDASAAERVLFTAIKQTFGRGYVWTNSQHKEVAREEELKEGDVIKGKKLIFTSGQVNQEERDAIVAVWILKRWAEVAEEKGFKKEALEKLSSADRAHMDMKWFKRSGALGGLAAVGGAC
ncbi:hypothetical protein QBC41DRAFT_324970 [Cercophora samala]|uniref:Uncharacterized protein n=1 Tax=Cercophora samala TaxID=330535 RepID=A0AA40DAP3_9PEZI|nr:hypothetical protein QBC41DRAFT_324970 [Cercophora samala]